MATVQGEYAKAGVDYRKIDPFKRAMIEIAKRTIHFPERRGVFANTDVLHSHGAVFEYRGRSPRVIWCKTQEGLGNKNWIAEWMYQNAGTGRTYYEGIGIDTVLMAANDLIAQGALPVIYTDEVAAGDSDWFGDKERAAVLAESFYRGCEKCGMALLAGESPALRYLVNAQPPVKSAPSLSGCATGIIAPRERLITGKDLRLGDCIIGVKSSGLHANGISLVIKRAMELPDKFLTKLPNGHTLGEEALILTRSYVALVEKLLDQEVDIHALLPATGSGISKVAFDERPFTYTIHIWPEVPPIFQFMRELGVSLTDCLTTFNWGVGYYIFVPETEVVRTLQCAYWAGYGAMEIGRVAEGERKVVFRPENITLPPPGE